MEKMTVRKRGKNYLTYASTKNMCTPILNMHTNVCDICKLSNPFNWFDNTLVKLVLQYSKGYEL